MNRVNELAFAKINLFLHLTGKREDGYHFVDSLVVFAELADSIIVQPSQELTLSITGEYGSQLSTKDNIILKAAGVLREFYRLDLGAKITLNKYLPVASGIGGGSADAAATLRALVHLWKIPATDKELLSISESLGADVSVCLKSAASYMSGIGEICVPAPTLTGLPLLLINPNQSLLTKDVFQKVSANFKQQVIHPESFASHEALLLYLNTTQNDLEDAAIHLIPEIYTVLNALETSANCLLARMSGSGATCFGIYETLNDAKDAANTLRKQYPTWWIQPTTVL